MDKKTIVVVEDESTTLEMLLQFLDLYDYQGIGASTGIEGLRLVEEIRPDLLLLDVMLPDMDGRVVAKLIRNKPKIDKIPIIMLSALVIPEEVRAGYEAGATRYVKKPVDLRILLEHIRAELRMGEHVPPPEVVQEADAYASPSGDSPTAPTGPGITISDDEDSDVDFVVSGAIDSEQLNVEETPILKRTEYELWKKSRIEKYTTASTEEPEEIDDRKRKLNKLRGFFEEMAKSIRDNDEGDK